MKTTEMSKNRDVKTKRCQEQEPARERNVARRRCRQFLFFFGHRWSCTHPVDTFFRPINSSESVHRWLAWVLLAKYEGVFRPTIPKRQKIRKDFAIEATVQLWCGLLWKAYKLCQNVQLNCSKTAADHKSKN